jgi:hypothetical protein
MFRKYLILFLLIVIKVNASVQPTTPKEIYEKLAIKLGQRGSSPIEGQEQHFEGSSRVLKKIRPTYHLTINDVQERRPSYSWHRISRSLEPFIDLHCLKTHNETASGLQKNTIENDRRDIFWVRDVLHDNLAEGGSSGKIIVIKGADNGLLNALIFYSGICFATLYGGIKDQGKAFSEDAVGNNLQNNALFVSTYKIYSETIYTLLKRREFEPNLFQELQGDLIFRNALVKLCEHCKEMVEQLFTHSNTEYFEQAKQKVDILSPLVKSLVIKIPRQKWHHSFYQNISETLWKLLRLDIIIIVGFFLLGYKGVGFF